MVKAKKAKNGAHAKMQECEGMGLGKSKTRKNGKFIKHKQRKTE